MIFEVVCLVLLKQKLQEVQATVGKRLDHVTAEIEAALNEPQLQGLEEQLEQPCLAAGEVGGGGAPGEA